MNPAMVRLAEQYRSQHGENKNAWNELRNLAHAFAKQREQALLDAAAAALAVGTIFHADGIDMSAVTPQMREAFSLAFPDKDIEALADYSPQELEGIVSAWKGKLFEVIVRDQLNAGEWVGDIYLREGQQAVLAEAANQPGWDLQILNADGTVAQELQIKATESLSYVKEALERFPHIDVITTEEVGSILSENFTDVHTAGISNEQLEQAIREPMTSLFDTGWEEVFETVLPFLPWVIITVGEGRHVLVRRKSLERAFSDVLERSIKTGVAIGAGAAAAFLFDAGIVSIPVTIATRLGIDRYQTFARAEGRVNRSKQRLIVLTDYYRALPMPQS